MKDDACEKETCLDDSKIKYQINRAKEYLKNNISNDGSEPKIEWCIISDLVRIIEA